MRRFETRHMAVCTGTPVLNPQDGHFLAGFIEAEGCFQITPVNGGASWRCSFGLAVRDDDSELLLELRELTGLGNVSRQRAVRNSKPQVLWSIAGRAECLCLAELLDQFPLRGRKRRELEVWSKGARITESDSGHDALPRLAHELRTLKRYVNPSRGLRPRAPFDEGLVAYLGGFFTGEGHLSLHDLRPRTVVKLRDDDRPLLEDLASATGLGYLYSAPQAGSTRPSIAWIILRQDQLRATVDLLERAGLRGRKARELAVWRRAVDELMSARSERRRPRRDFMTVCKDELHEARRYRPGPDFEAPSRRERLNERYIRALRDAADAVDGPLTVTKYEALRRQNPQMPNRKTIARAFGGWRQALTAAGLGDRRGPRKGRTGLVLELSDWEEIRRRRDDSRRVVEVVERLAVETGRPPTVHEYLAWRIANDKSLPCLAKVYDLFPGGWSSVKVAAGIARAA